MNFYLDLDLFLFTLTTVAFKASADINNFQFILIQNLPVLAM